MHDYKFGGGTRVCRGWVKTKWSRLDHGEFAHLCSINICKTKDLFFTLFFNKEMISKKYHKAFPIFCAKPSAWSWLLRFFGFDLLHLIKGHLFSAINTTSVFFVIQTFVYGGSPTRTHWSRFYRHFVALGKFINLCSGITTLKCSIRLRKISFY